jgi:D-alanyl-D-alanine carboxypeptidase
MGSRLFSSIHAVAVDGYRPLAEQRQLRRLKPRFAARPGYSEHGWGLAVDLSCGV